VDHRDGREGDHSEQQRDGDYEHRTIPFKRAPRLLPWSVVELYLET